jgi:hypothetical protein
LYILVSGTLPFDSENIQTLKQIVLQCKYRVPYYVSKDCENLLSHMLVVNPSKRFKLHQIKLHHWIKTNSPNYYYIFKNNKSMELFTRTKSKINRSFNRISNRFKSKSFKVINKDKQSSPSANSAKAINTNNNASTVNSLAPNINSNNYSSNESCNKYTNQSVINGKNLHLSTAPSSSVAKLNLSSISLPIYSFEEYRCSKKAPIKTNSLINDYCSMSKSCANLNPNFNSAVPSVYVTDLNRINEKNESTYINKVTEMMNQVSFSEQQDSQPKSPTQNSYYPSCSGSVGGGGGGGDGKVSLAHKMLGRKRRSHYRSCNSNASKTNAAYNLKCNAFAKTMHSQNSSSMDDEGVGEEDMESAASSSFSTDIFSSSINSSILVSSFESQKSHPSMSFPAAGFSYYNNYDNYVTYQQNISSNSSINSTASSNNYLLSVNTNNRVNNYKQKIQTPKKKMFNNNKNKSDYVVNDLSEIKNELKQLIRSNMPVSACNSSNCLTFTSSNTTIANNNNSTQTIQGVNTTESNNFFQKYKQYIFFKNSKKNILNMLEDESSSSSKNTPLEGAAGTACSGCSHSNFHHYHYHTETYEKIGKQIANDDNHVLNKKSNLDINNNNAKKISTSNLVKCNKRFLYRQRSSSLSSICKINIVNNNSNQLTANKMKGTYQSSEQSKSGSKIGLTRALNKSFNNKFRISRKYSLKN